MRIKKYKAPTMKEARDLVSRELGEKAVILSSRTIDKPGAASEVEIVAAIDDQAKISAALKSKPSESVDILQNYLQKKQESGKTDDGFKKYLDIAGRIFDQIGNLSDSMAELSDSVKYRNINSLSKSYSSIYKLLCDNGFSEDYSLRLCGSLSSENPDDQVAVALKRVRSKLIANIRTVAPLKKKKEPAITSFVGPTGSGKTTTIAKLGIVSKLLFDSNIIFISTDTRKIGGAEQLETYGAVAGIPFEAAYSPHDLKEIVLKNYETDFIFIDTPGISQFDGLRMKEINSFLMPVSHDYIYLVQSINSGKKNFLSVTNEFRKVNVSALILTKFDEAASIGEVLEAMQTINLPLAYYTNGQKVPEDLEPAETDKLEQIIFPDEVLGHLE